MIPMSRQPILSVVLHLESLVNLQESIFHQGTKVVITGRIQTGSYTNRDGQKVYTTDVVVEDQEFAESKATADTSGSYTPTRSNPTTPAGEGFMNIPDGVDDEGLPFN